MRRLALLVVGVSLGVAMPAQAADFPSDFANPPREVQPKFRWWWPNALVDNAEIANEVDQMADAGFGGAEISDVHHSTSTGLDPAGHGWGTQAWVDAMQVALERAKARGMTMDFASGPSWPSAVPSITPDSGSAIKELAYGRATITGGQTFSGPAPAPVIAPASGVTTKQLRYVQALKIATAGNPPSTAYTLDKASLVNLTPDGENVTFTPPDSGNWLLIAYWERGSGQKPEGSNHTTPDSYVVDHFSKAGTAAITDFWDGHILTPTIRSLIKDAGGAFFEDSLEIETDATIWTPEFADAFEAQLGYSLIPYLPLIVKQDEKTIFNYDSDTNGRVRRDINLVLTNLYNDNHVKPLKAWANALGLKLRVQPYGLQTDAMQASALVDIPEGESLGFKNLDDYRRQAGARDMAGNTILSNEAGATAGGAYATTWDQTLRKLAPMFAAGVNQNVFHGFSYLTAPAARWPGFAAFSPYNGASGYGESWGPRQPTWKHVSDVSAYFARNQEVMQTGRNQLDAAVLAQTGYVAAGYGAPFFTPDTREAAQVLKDGGTQIGWTNETISESLLDLPTASVRNGRLAPDGPNFKTLVIEGDVAFSRGIWLRASTATKLVAWAKAGLPIVLVGNWSAPTVSGLAKPGEVDAVKAAVVDLLGQPTVRNVADRAGIPVALAALNVQRDVEYGSVQPVQTAHRVDGAKDYYFLANTHATAAASFDATFAMTDPSAVPYVADAWTGTLKPVANYSVVNGRLKTRIDLKAGQTTILVLGKDLAKLPVHATASDADLVRADGKNVVIRDTTPGTYTTTLDDGRAVATTIGAVAAPKPLTQWSLDVDDWIPGTTPTTTAHVPHTLQLDGLKAWPAIPELADVSGLGTYTTTFEWDGAPAYLELGEVFDTYRVWINGRALPPSDQLNTTLDAGPYLIKGQNTIKVEVATTLNNRLRVVDVAFKSNTRQNYGLVGPARLVPYGEAAVYAQTEAGGTVGGSVPATLALSLSGPASFGAFTPGIDKTYDASTQATVTSTAGDAALTVSDPGRLKNGAFSLAQPLEVLGVPKTYAGPVSNDTVDVGFRQRIGRTEPLRTGSYATTVTFTLSTTTP
ncbi:glycosyl hydrolase [Solirubrobacter phytolaccae]|uniref:Glycosyl hydrolase n=1 Tax=Solirubrobacter phytolaccae TaxID=1404360 RepID=A0A9X3ND62_9ACTN|nr:glycosyl hydrolase [Solirubrobacter phytolaccae]MDA0184268.1 glycosyl hydrolase [Solirubrobacter phytolaccae]